MNFNSKWNVHGYGNKRELRKSDWTGVGLTAEVIGEGKRRVVWNPYKGGFKSSILVKRNQRKGSRVHNDFVLYKGSWRSSKWVNQRMQVGGPSSGSWDPLQPVVGSVFKWAP